jgi:hypothetical protein
MSVGKFFNQLLSNKFKMCCSEATRYMYLSRSQQQILFVALVTWYSGQRLRQRTENRGFESPYGVRFLGTWSLHCCSSFKNIPARYNACVEVLNAVVAEGHS